MDGSSEEEECHFFDAHEDIASISGVLSDRFEISDSVCQCNGEVQTSFQYDLWIHSPRSVRERRCKFFDWMRVELDEIAQENLVDVCSIEGDIDRIREKSGAVLRTSGLEDEFCSIRSSVSCCSNDNSDLSEELRLRDNFLHMDGNSDWGAGCGVHDVGHCEQGTEQSVLTSKSYSSYQEVMGKEVGERKNQVGTVKKVKKRWLSRLRILPCVVDRQGKTDKSRADDDDAYLRRVQRVKVRQCRKRLKELSALYKGQDIQAHVGSILTMKFSPDGQYLASAGEDMIVRLWQVVEDKRSNDHDIPEIDPSCIYFTVNHLSELKPLFVDKEKMGKLRSLRKTSDSACVIIPPKVFRILEKPLHEFHGHCNDILDLAWSKTNYLLSSSVDKTVRLWRVGCDDCLKVFSHNNYVTCVQFNPVDDNYFISGSIDGKVRIWAIPGCHVVDWTDTRDIVTAVCYRPDGKGGIVGSMAGTCCFYNISDNHLQLDAQICLHNKKKSLCKRITGFQFFPQDSSKVMVTCADSQVRILHGLNVICKYKGLRNSGNQISACFTSDGKHIVSACEDSNVYVWNCVDEALPQAQTIRSCERFSTNASVVLPWGGLKYGTSESGWQFPASNSLQFTSPVCFALSQDYFLESFPKGSATWPEEKLPTSSLLSTSSAMRKSQYKFLKSSCQSISSSHTWGLVIVTAGWDGRIQSFLNYGLPVSI
ncbi:WD40 domain-containing protein [Cephalotus follicularis]|uniref:WD40 domain-containing protein n=1 Tax=Cephalotus follicularis TaxID=3775 RepID=A0A1Q3CRZ1_CEPFO|nr:WD40 domain-containing protein [Cephalotus follicularis]